MNRDGFIQAGGIWDCWKKPGINRDTHIHYSTMDGSLNTITHMETIDRKTRAVMFRAKFISERWACGNKEEVRSIIRSWEKKYPGKKFLIRGYGCDKPGTPKVFEIWEKVGAP